MPPPPPTLKHFILQARVLGLYRYAIRAARNIPDQAARKETIKWIRSEFERNRHIYDVSVIEEKLATGRRDLKQYFPATLPYR
ncbi:complex 1 protein-domain-containing protein [Vararia minispora EC-137]|uniref:Complex 1 protein-domain-containing protein n=1 Tax=Vararia minispora EC-137 TaxID=1314806 RepID=A0ACB8QNI6_9AGAM|nr:complex 1 protein-domain-containing protein [Vararia minispora EC-137]